MAGTGGESSGGYGGSFGTGSSEASQFKGERLKSKRGRVLFQAEQKVDSTDSIEIFKATSTKGLASAEAPKSIVIENTGNAGLGVTLKVPIWTGDATQSGSNYLQMVLAPGEKIDLGTTRIVDSLNSGFMEGDVVSTFTAPSSDLYTDSGANLSSHVDSPDTSINVDKGLRFRVGDLIQLGDDSATASKIEIMEVTGITDTAADGLFTPAALSVKRALYGSNLNDKDAQTDGTDGSVSGANVYFPFFNTNAEYDKYSTVHTDSSGVFAAKNFFGLGRGDTIQNSGIGIGSIAILIYLATSQGMGLQGISATSNSGLTSGEIYYIKVAVNSGTAYEVGFTVDSTSFGGTNGVLSKINAILREQYTTAGSPLLGKLVTVGIVNGDVRWTFEERKSTSTIDLTAGTTGDTSHDLIANALGVFPASVLTAVPTKLPSETIYDPATYESKPNTGALLYDNGHGQFVGNGSGTINYETGEIRIRTARNAELLFVASHSSGLAGRASSTKGNIIEEVFARSASPKVNSRIKLTVRG